MESLTKVLDNFEEKIIAVLLPVMCIVVFMATFFRYTGLLIIPWGEELARYLMVWIVFFGIAAGAKNNRHFGVSFFVDRLPVQLQKGFEIFRTLVISGFLVFVMLQLFGLMQLQIKMEQISPALGIPMWFAYLAVPVGCFLMIVRQLQYTWNALKKSRETDHGKELE